MLHDFTNQYIAQLLAHCQISGKTVLEIGCGTGRITRDLIDHAHHVMAMDPDGPALAVARAALYAGNVSFRQAPLQYPAFPPGAFDLVLYPLSLHRLPLTAMGDNLRHATELLDTDGILAAIEPTDGGALTYAMNAFGGSTRGEREALAAAQQALRSVPGWRASFSIPFDVLFQFADAEEFISSMLPEFTTASRQQQAEARAFLARHTTDEGIILDAARQLVILRREDSP
jgi:SAM-dependent methyltransferase